MKTWRQLKQVATGWLTLGVAGVLSAAELKDYHLLGELNCTACHAATPTQAAWINPHTASNLQDITQRLNPAWVRDFLANPQESHGWKVGLESQGSRETQAEAITQFLWAKHPQEFRYTSLDKGALARGENLYHTIGCVACHAPQSGTPLKETSVPLKNLAQKWSWDGLRRFLQDPLAVHASGRMPSMHLVGGEAGDLAHYLLREVKVPAHAELALLGGRFHSLEDLDTAEVVRTMPLEGFTMQGPMKNRGVAYRITAWVDVKTAGSYQFYLQAAGACRLSVDGQWIIGEGSWQRDRIQDHKSVNLKAGKHELKVEYAYRGNKDPLMSLEWEGPGQVRGPLPSELLSSESVPVVLPPSFEFNSALVEQGRQWYEARQCEQCHRRTEVAAKAMPLQQLKLNQGCLASQPASGAFLFNLTASQRLSLQAAIQVLQSSGLTLPSGEQKLHQTLTDFNCLACHQRDGLGGVPAERNGYFTSNVDDLGDEGRLPPKLDGVGDKLRPEWLKRLLDEGAPVRPYLNTRMPQFGVSNVGLLAPLLVSLDRKAQSLPPVSDSHEAQLDAGRRLLGTDGLSCIVCHRYNRQPAHSLQVLDLLTVPDRLNEDWFRRFLKSPEKFNPGTRMPSLWPNGQSLIKEVLAGDTNRQHAAIWTYLSEGPKAKFPEGLSRQSMELVVGGEPVVYRGKMWEAGFRGLAIGLPGQVNLAYDTETMRLALLWHERFLNVAPHWQSQGMGRIRPLGRDVMVHPQGSAWAALSTSDAPWPAVEKNSLQAVFKGYSLDAQQQPTVLYRLTMGAASSEVAERNWTEVLNGKTTLHRELKLSEAMTAGTWLRLGVGKLVAQPDHTSWRWNDTVTVHLPSSVSSRVRLRGEGDQSEFLIPMEGLKQLLIDYAW
jgi:mono/diheme cytochrome c family protein